MLGEPVAEQRADLARQAEDDVAGAGDAGLLGGGEDRLDLVVVEAGDDRRDRDPRRDAGLGEAAEGEEAALRRGGAGLHGAGEAAVEGGDGEAGGGEAGVGHLGEDVGVALDQRALGEDRHRVVEVAQTREDLAGDAELLLERLVGVGVGAHRHHRRAVAAAGELGAEDAGGLGLGGEPGLEVEAGGEAEEGVGGAGEAVDAAVLAAAVGVDRAVEGDVGAVVPGDDRARALDRDLGAGGRDLLVDVPAVVDGDALVALEAAGHVEAGAAGAAGGLRHLARFVSDHGRETRTQREHAPARRGWRTRGRFRRGALSGFGIGD